METQIRIVKIGSREFLQIAETGMIPVDSIEDITCDQGGATDGYAFRLQIDYSGKYKFIARDARAVRIWKVLAPPDITAEIAPKKQIYSDR